MTGKQLDKVSDPVGWTALSGYSRQGSQYDAGFDFPRITHLDHEPFTFSLFDLTIPTFLVLGGWKLIALTISLI